MSTATQNASGIFSHVFWPGLTGIARLDQEALRWETFKLRSVRYSWHNRTATTTSGDFVAAIDYNPDRLAQTEAELLIKNPQIQSSLWQEGKAPTLSVDPRLAMKANTHRCYNPTASTSEVGTFGATHALCIYSKTAMTSDQFPRLRVHYVIEFFNQVVNSAIVPNTIYASDAANKWTVPGSTAAVTSAVLRGGTGLPFSFTGPTAGWTTLATSLAAAGATLVISKDLTGGAQRFVNGLCVLGARSASVALPAVANAVFEFVGGQ